MTVKSNPFKNKINQEYLSIITEIKSNPLTQLSFNLSVPSKNTQKDLVIQISRKIPYPLLNLKLG